MEARCRVERHADSRVPAVVGPGETASGNYPIESVQTMSSVK